MKRYVSTLSVAYVLSLFAACQLTELARAQTRGGPAAMAPQSPASQSIIQAAPKPSLNCAGCHGPGNTLPYLGDSLFHVQAHQDYDHGYHAGAHKNGSKAAVCLDCHTANGDMTTMLPASNPESTVNRANIMATCGKCHGDPEVMQNTAISNRPFLAYRESVHGHALAGGKLGAAVCTDCHGSHDIRPASDPQSGIFKTNIPEICGQCHSKIAAEFNRSVHGEASSRGVSRSPVCTDCHGIHNIKPPVDKATSTATQAIATGSCARCHQGVALAQEYGIEPGRVSSYEDSYHGLAAKLGAKFAANCASCHGVHNILPSSNPDSMIHPRNLVRTCGQCHPGAGESFAVGRVHLNVAPADTVAGVTTNAEDAGAKATRWVRLIYVNLIVAIVGGMVLHNGLAWRRKLIEKKSRERRTILRMTARQRFQHWLLLSSFIVLVISGFALAYPDSWVALPFSEPLRRAVHRAAAIVMILVGVYHAFYVAATGEGRQSFRAMLPRVKDVTDLAQAVRYYLGGRTAKPRAGRFGYAEKAEYWAVIWGTLIMSLTGIMIWFKVEAFGFLTRWWIDVAIAIHFYEAVLATLSIIVWHFYLVIFDPDVYPVNLAFVDGHMSEEMYKEEHALDYEILMRERVTEKDGQEEVALPDAGEGAGSRL